MGIGKIALFAPKAARTSQCKGIHQADEIAYFTVNSDPWLANTPY